MLDYILKLTDGTELQFATGSTIYNLIGIYETFAAIDAVREKLTKENLKGATFNGQIIEDLIPSRIDITNAIPGGNIEAHFINEPKTDIDKLKEQIEELQVAVSELANLGG